MAEMRQRKKDDDKIDPRVAVFRSLPPSHRADLEKLPSLLRLTLWQTTYHLLSKSQIMATEKDFKLEPKARASKSTVDQRKKERKKNVPDKPQPRWLFPPPAENPVLNGKTKTAEEIKQELEDRMAAIKLLKHGSLRASKKSTPPALLLTLVGSFLSSYGFNSASRLYTLEWEARKQLDGWEGITDQKVEKGTPDLAKIFREWERKQQEVAALETSSVEDDSSSGDSSNDDGEDAALRLKSQATAGHERRETKTAQKSDVVKHTSVPKDSDDSIDSSDSSDSDDSKSSDSSEDVARIAEPPMAKAAPRNPEARAKATKESDSSEESTHQPSIISSTTLNATPPMLDSLQDQTAASENTSSSESSSSDDEPASAPPFSPPPPPKPQQQPKRKRSASPKVMAEKSSKMSKKTSKPFSRIPDDVQLDPRLASNAYVPYEYAERAHQDLVVTKGKEFTKEKNKKKRGSYRGGVIDTSGGKAIKFDDDGN